MFRFYGWIKYTSNSYLNDYKHKLKKQQTLKSS